MEQIKADILWALMTALTIVTWACSAIADEIHDAANANDSSASVTPALNSIYGLQLVEKGANETRYYDKRGNAEIIVPNGYHFVPAVSNKQVVYDFGLKKDTELFEVRIRFDRPLGPTHEEQQKFEQEHPGSQFVGSANQDEVSAMWAITMESNLSGGKFGTYESFPPDAVKKEFGADWGVGSHMFELKDPDFAGPYKYGQIVAQIHKHNVGMYTVLQVFESPKLGCKLADEAFHVVKFMEKK